MGSRATSEAPEPTRPAANTAAARTRDVVLRRIEELRSPAQIGGVPNLLQMIRDRVAPEDRRTCARALQQRLASQKLQATWNRPQQAKYHTLLDELLR